MNKMTIENKKIWLNNNARAHIKEDGRYVPAHYEVRFSCVHIFDIAFLYDLNQFYFTMGRDDLILLRDAINKKLLEEEE